MLKFKPRASAFRLQVVGFKVEGLGHASLAGGGRRNHWQWYFLLIHQVSRQKVQLEDPHIYFERICTSRLERRKATDVAGEISAVYPQAPEPRP